MCVSYTVKKEIYYKSFNLLKNEQIKCKTDGNSKKSCTEC